MAALGVPAHVTILFPFLAAERVDGESRLALATIAAGRARFSARFQAVKRAASSVWLVPTPQAAFLDLTAAVAARWPDHPPYGGIHGDDLVAHLTLVENDDPATLETVVARASAAGPFDVEVTELTLITEGHDGRWHERWRVPLGAHLAEGTSE
jgi:2'-5' RNA ligase